MKVTLVRSRAIDSAIYKVAKSLSQNGYDVKLLVWDREGNRKTENSNGYAICRFGFKAPHDKLTALFYLPIWWLYEFFFLLRNDSEVIHACDLDTLLPAILVKLIKRVKLCYMVYDFYANNLPDGHIRLIRNVVRSLVASIEKFGIRFAEVLFLADECRYEEVKGARIKSLVYIYNSPSDCFSPKWKQESDGTGIVVFYAGLIHRSRGIEYMIRSVEDSDNVKLILAGTGPDKELVEKCASRCKKIQYIGWIPSYEEVIKRTLKSDILFRFGDPKIPKSKYESPNKLFEAMMCGKPIIVNSEIAASKIVQNENCGVIIPYGNVKAVKEAIVKLKNSELRQELGINGRRAYEEKYSWDIMEKRLLNAYEEMVKTNNP
jgi:glycosyltransferase involved in cell wall biosynthesis